MIRLEVSEVLAELRHPVLQSVKLLSDHSDHHHHHHHQHHHYHPSVLIYLI